MPGEMTSAQRRCATLAFRCFIGFSKHDKEKKNLIPEEKALQEWDELLEKRFPQPNSGGKPFVLKIVRIVKNRKTDEGLDLSDKPTILERLAKWSKDMCNKHNIDPGSEGMQALEQQLSWHEEQMNGHSGPAICAGERLETSPPCTDHQDIQRKSNEAYNPLPKHLDQLALLELPRYLCYICIYIYICI